MYIHLTAISRVEHIHFPSSHLKRKHQHQCMAIVRCPAVFRPYTMRARDYQLSNCNRYILCKLFSSDNSEKLLSTESEKWYLHHDNAIVINNFIDNFTDAAGI